MAYVGKYINHNRFIPIVYKTN